MYPIDPIDNTNTNSSNSSSSGTMYYNVYNGDENMYEYSVTSPINTIASVTSPPSSSSTVSIYPYHPHHHHHNNHYYQHLHNHPHHNQHHYENHYYCNGYHYPQSESQYWQKQIQSQQQQQQKSGVSAGILGPDSMTNVRSTASVGLANTSYGNTNSVSGATTLHLPSAAPIGHIHPQQQQQQQQQYTSNVVGGPDPLNALQNLTVTAGQSNQIINNNIRINPAANYPSNLRPRPALMAGPAQARMNMYQQPSNVDHFQSPMMIGSSQPQSNPSMICVPSSAGPVSIKQEMISSQFPHHPVSNMSYPQLDPNKRLMYSNVPTTVSSSASGSILPQPSGVPSQMSIQPAGILPGTASKYSNITPSFGVSGGPPYGPHSVASTAPNVSQSSTKHSASSSSSSATPIVISEEEAKRVREEIRRLKDRYITSLRLMIERGSAANSGVSSSAAGNQDEERKIWSGYTVLRSILENPDTITKPLTMKHIPKIEQHLIKAETHLLTLEPSLAHTIRPMKMDPGHMSDSGAMMFKSEDHVSNRPLIIHGSSTSIVTSASAASVAAAAGVSASLASASSTASASAASLTHQNIINGTSNNNNAINDPSSSLEAAFDHVCQQIARAPKRSIDKLHATIVEHIKTKQPKYSYMLPRSLSHCSNGSSTNTCNNKSEEVIALDGPPIEHQDSFDPKEFDYIDNIKIEGLDQYLGTDDDPWDEEGFLRTDIDDISVSNFEFKNVDLETEMNKLSSEFEIKKVYPIKESGTVAEEREDGDGVKYDTLEFTDFSDKKGAIYRLRYVDLDKMIDNSVAKSTDCMHMLVKIPDDYDESGLVDWHDACKQDNTNTGNTETIFDANEKEDKDNWTGYYRILLHQLLEWNKRMYIWEGLSLSHVASIYKKAILKAYRFQTGKMGCTVED